MISCMATSAARDPHGLPSGLPCPRRCADDSQSKSSTAYLPVLRQESDLQEPLLNHPRFLKVKDLGKGTTGFMQLARDVFTNELVAIKFVPRGWEREQSKYVLREILHHQQLTMAQHPHVVQFKEVFLTKHHLAIVMEYVPGLDLSQLLELLGSTLPERLARFLFQQLVFAVDFMHRRGKVHRNLKLTKLLVVDNGTELPLLKISDFQFSKDTLANSAPISQVGPALFVPPEVMLSNGQAPYSGQAMDVWACGVILYIMLFRRHPFISPDDSSLSDNQKLVRLVQNVLTGKLYLPPDAAQLSPQCLQLLQMMLHNDPAKRATVASVMAHPWFMTELPPYMLLQNSTYPISRQFQLSDSQDALQIEQLVALASKPDTEPLQGSNSGSLQPGEYTPTMHPALLAASSCTDSPSAVLFANDAAHSEPMDELLAHQRHQLEEDSAMAMGLQAAHAAASFCCPPPVSISSSTPENSWDVPANNAMRRVTAADLGWASLSEPGWVGVADRGLGADMSDQWRGLHGVQDPLCMDGCGDDGLMHSLHGGRIDLESGFRQHRNSLHSHGPQKGSPVSPLGLQDMDASNAWGSSASVFRPQGSTMTTMTTGRQMQR